MAGRPEQAREAGKLGGRPKGVKNAATIERDVARQEFAQLVLQRIKPLFHSQLSLAHGVQFVYRIDVHGGGPNTRVEHVLLEDPIEIAAALDTIANEDPNGDLDNQRHGYVYITARAPENKAIDSLYDRVFGKAQQSVDHTTLGEKMPTPLLHVLHNNGDNKNSSAQ